MAASAVCGVVGKIKQNQTANGEGRCNGKADAGRHGALPVVDVEVYYSTAGKRISRRKYKSCKTNEISAFRTNSDGQIWTIWRVAFLCMVLTYTAGSAIMEKNKPIAWNSTA